MAKHQGNKVEDTIARILSGEHEKRSFIVEAGAGAGKTYALEHAVDWLQENKWQLFKSKRMSVACITYTNAAVEVIQARLHPDSFIKPSTIHHFIWNLMAPYQYEMGRIIRDHHQDFTKKDGIEEIEIHSVQYTLGVRDYKDGVWYLHHDDVPKMFAYLMEREKFRKILACRYPIILIDEYQDTSRHVMEAFIKHFISKNEGPQFGLFGDAWQTIYEPYKVYGKVKDDHLEVLPKYDNRRSAKRLVDMLNILRSRFKQTAKAKEKGEVWVITCDDCNDREGSRNDISPEVFQKRLNNLEENIKASFVKDDETLKVLMLTHNMLARRQGYETLMKCMGDRLKDQTDDIYSFCVNELEQINDALKSQEDKAVCELLSLHKIKIKTKSEKSKWKEFGKELAETMEFRSIGEVLRVVEKYKLVSLTSSVKEYLDLYKTNPLAIYHGNSTVQDVMEVSYKQVRAVKEFFQPSSIFSTQHGVKGEEYDNVLFVISSGWNNAYNYIKYAPKILTAGEDDENDKTYVRNRNLFYVCCSRAKKRMFFFVTLPKNDEFSALLHMFTDKYLTYPEFIKYCEQKIKRAKRKMENKQATSS